MGRYLIRTARRGHRHAVRGGRARLHRHARPARRRGHRPARHRGRRPDRRPSARRWSATTGSTSRWSDSSSRGWAACSPATSGSRSPAGGRSAELIADALPVTIELAVLATLIGSLVGVGHRRDRRVARQRRSATSSGRAFGLLGLGHPELRHRLDAHRRAGRQLLLLPVGGHATSGFFEYAGRATCSSSSGPALMLGVGLAAAIMRTTRSAYLEASSQDFVRTARARVSTAAAGPLAARAAQLARSRS